MFQLPKCDKTELSMRSFSTLLARSNLVRPRTDPSLFAWIDCVECLPLHKHFSELTDGVLNKKPDRCKIRTDLRPPVDVVKFISISDRFQLNVGCPHLTQYGSESILNRSKSLLV